MKNSIGYRLFREHLWGYLRLIFTLDVVIPIISLSVGIGVGGSLRYPAPNLVTTVIIAVIIALIYPGIIGAAMAGRAFREILAPRFLSRFELGMVIAVGMGIPIGVIIYYRIWEVLGVWILGSGLLLYWHWLSFRAGPNINILRETVGAVLLVPFPMLLVWTAYIRNFFPDREIGLVILIFGLLALSANLGRAWSEAGGLGPSSGSFFGKAEVIIAAFTLSFLFLFFGIQKGIFMPMRMQYLKFGGVITFIISLLICYLGFTNIFDKVIKNNKLTRYVYYGVIFLGFLGFWLAYKSRPLRLM